LPKCFIDKLGFYLDKNYERLHFFCFDTTVSKKGPDCQRGDKSFKHSGFTWIKGNQLNYGGGNGSPGSDPQSFFDQTSVPYFYEVHKKV